MALAPLLKEHSYDQANDQQLDEWQNAHLCLDLLTYALIQRLTVGLVLQPFRSLE